MIRKDIRLTKDVDVSITRFLEGVVAYVAEDAATTTTNAAASDSTLSDSIGAPSVKTNAVLSTAAGPVFAKSSHMRQSCFAERKKTLIEQSRQRYLRRTAASAAASAGINANVASAADVAEFGGGNS